MTNAEILSYIDHTVLKQDAKWEDIAQICEEALRYGTASVCIPSYYVRRAKTAYPALNVCTVIGFPLGYQPGNVKAFEAAEAVSDGADEIDMVINVSALKNGEDQVVLDEIKAVRKACENQVLKVIIETCCLTEDEKIRCCGLVTEGGADYIKTSTGFGSAGAQLEDIALFKKHIGENVKIKAAGGIRTREQMEAFLDAGCSRIGCSAARILFDEA
ncbi:MAG: deoxyribose-phosphate aldolase [Oscillospiraceae bacterium]|nr:deoxyribose-phosphate aldolase [Oscillospiraceae bacterium]